VLRGGLFPARRGGLLGDLAPPLGGELGGALLPALRRATTHGDGCWGVLRHPLRRGFPDDLQEEFMSSLDGIVGSLGTHGHTLLTVTRAAPTETPPLGDLLRFADVPLDHGCKVGQLTA
jgi:hypothetical protein